MSVEDMSQIPDVPKGGPLEDYRKQATFNWKQMKLFFEEMEHIKYKDHIWETLRRDPLFNRQIDDITMEKQKELAAKRMKRLAEYAFLGLKREDAYDFPIKRILYDEATVMWDIDSSIKYSLHFEMFQILLSSMGTERHQHFIKKCETLECFGCFALTEMSHGSNTREMKTTAHYDPKTEEFVINSPSFEDCKIWVGNLGKCATHAAVFAQLYTPDGVCHGLHIFIVPVRDPHTLYALPGITVGDMGAKAGLNGVDNGFLIFNNVRVQRENLLNRTGDVTPDGRYVTPFKDPNKRFGISLGALSNGRVGLTFYAHGFMSQALTIALRYAAVRKQFGPVAGQEVPILEYQTHQCRLLPPLALCYVWKNFSTSLFTNLAEFLVGLFAKDTSERQAELGKEIHAISCASKPVSSWTTQQVVQECREACGGHGYLKASKFAELRNNNDPLLTFEGDNNVLIQQTSNYILSAYEEYLKTKKVQPTPLSSIDFMNDIEGILSRKATITNREELLNVKTIMGMFDWLVCYLIKTSYEKYNHQLNTLKKDPFTSRNDSQVFHLKTLSIAFIERLIIERFVIRIQENDNRSLDGVLHRVLYLASLHLLEKYLITFYQGGYFTTTTTTTNGNISCQNIVALIHDTVLYLCNEMKADSMALVDAIAPPDYVLNSILGHSDGNVYKHLYSSMIQSPGCFERLSWYNDKDGYMDKKPFGHLQSKL